MFILILTNTLNTASAFFITFHENTLFVKANILIIRVKNYYEFDNLSMGYYADPYNIPICLLVIIHKSSLCDILRITI